MKKEEVIVNYAGTGVKTLKILAWVFFVGAILQIIGTLIIIFIPINIIEINVYSIFLLVGSFLFNLLSFGICAALATITENSIFNKIYNEKLLENKGIIIDFKKVEKVEKVNWYD